MAAAGELLIFARGAIMVKIVSSMVDYIEQNLTGDIYVPVRLYKIRHNAHKLSVLICGLN